MRYLDDGINTPKPCGPQGCWLGGVSLHCFSITYGVLMGESPTRWAPVFRDLQTITHDKENSRRRERGRERGIGVAGCTSGSSWAARTEALWDTRGTPAHASLRAGVCMRVCAPPVGIHPQGWQRRRSRVRWSSRGRSGAITWGR